VLKEAVTERLKYLTEVFRVVWVFLLATVSGTIGLLLGPHDFWRSAFAGAGVVAIIVLVIVIGVIHKRVKKLLAKLEEM
jgi:MFS family permease